MKPSWLKLSVDLFSDKKIILLRRMPSGDTLLVLWTWLLCEAMKSSEIGAIPITEGDDPCEEISALSSIELNTVRLGMAFFQKHKMVCLDDGKIEISKFRKHQNIEAIEHANRQSLERVRRYRERQKIKFLSFEKHVENSVTRNTTVTNDTENETEIENENKEIREEKTATEDGRTEVSIGDATATPASPKQEKRSQTHSKSKSIALPALDAQVAPSKAFIDYFFDGFIKATCQDGLPEEKRAKPVINYTIFTSSTKAALKCGLSLDDLKKMAVLFFRDKKVAEQGYPVQFFWTNLNKYRLAMNGVNFVARDKKDDDRSDRDQRVLQKLREQRR